MVGAVWNRAGDEWKTAAASRRYIWDEVSVCVGVLVGAVWNRAHSLTPYYLSASISQWSKFKGVDQVT